MAPDRQATASEVASARQALASGWLDGAGAAPTPVPLGDGHINATFLVEHPRLGRGVLQRISPAVFPDPLVTARNVEAVVDWLAGRQLVPDLVAAVDGRRHWLDAAAGCWRLWRWVAGSEALTALPGPAHAEAAGRAFGRLQEALVGLAPPATPSLPGFLDLDAYLAQWDDTLAGIRLPAELAEAATRIERGRQRFATLAGEARLIHGDCKISNLLFARGSARVLRVVDLDTVMWAPWALDYGDLIRSGAALPAAEGPGFDTVRYAALTRGFLAEAAVRTSTEALVEAPARVCFMLALRFLTDHLQGDRYFRVAQRGDNRRRAFEQFGLLDAMARDREPMLRIAERLLNPPARAPAGPAES